MTPRRATSGAMATTAAALLVACLFACLGGAHAAALEFRRCESVEFIIAADGLARRVAERGLVGPTATQLHAFYTSASTVVCAQSVAERLYRAEAAACSGGPGGCGGGGTSKELDAESGGGTAEVSDTGEARAAAAAATASAEGAAAAPGDSIAVPPLDERTKRVARSLAGVTAAASDALASAPATSGAVPVQSAALYAFFLSLASALGPMPHAHAVVWPGRHCSPRHRMPFNSRP